MLVSEKDAIDGARVAHAIGRICAVSRWCAQGRASAGGDWRERLLRDLIRRAEDVDADAIIGVDYQIDAVAPHEGGVKLERLCATGIAVRLAHAA